MAQILVWASVASSSGLLLGVVALALRRARLARAGRRRAQIERRVQRVALAVVDGAEAPSLRPDEQAVLEDVVLRYSRWVEGDDRRAFAAFFTAGGRVARELKRLESRRAWRRAEAVSVLGNTAAEETLAPLVGALDDRTREVRAAAARALGRLADAHAVQPLVQALVRGSVPAGIVTKALLAIGADAVPSLCSLLHDGDPKIRALAVDLIGYLGGPAEAAAAAGLLADPAAGVRAQAAHALGRLAAHEGTAGLRALLADRVGFVRAAAAEALGTIGDTDALPQLIRIASHDDHDPARAAALAVGHIDPHALADAATTSRHLQAAADLLEAAA